MKPRILYFSDRFMTLPDGLLFKIPYQSKEMFEVLQFELLISIGLLYWQFLRKLVTLLIEIVLR